MQKKKAEWIQHWWLIMAACLPEESRGVYAQGCTKVTLHAHIPMLFQCDTRMCECHFPFSYALQSD